MGQQLSRLVTWALRTWSSLRLLALVDWILLSDHKMANLGGSIAT